MYVINSLIFSWLEYISRVHNLANISLVQTDSTQHFLAKYSSLLMRSIDSSNTGFNRFLVFVFVNKTMEKAIRRLH